jgi:hypothetical protein
MRTTSPNNRVRFEKANIDSNSSKKSSLTWNLRVHFNFQKGQQPVPVLRQKNSENL